MGFIFNAIIIGLILSFLVIIHELGHYLAARWKKVRVEEFGLGYPPRALSLFKKWGTLFSLNWIPFGGFVRMEGEDGEATQVSAEEKKNKQGDGPFYEKSATARLIIILAGATVNFVFGVLAFSIVFSIWGIPSGAIIAEVMPDSPAAQASLPVDRVVTEMVADGQNIPIRSASELVTVVNAHLGQSVVFETHALCDKTLCSDSYQEYQVQLRSAEDLTEEKRGLGVRPADFAQFYPWYEMPFRGAWFGLIQALQLGLLILQALFQMVSNLVTRAIVPQEVMGPVGIVHQATQNELFTNGPLATLLFAGMISINLAVMNVLPIPALDGGRAVFILLEKIIGKHRIHAVEQYANFGGYAVLLALIFLITARDIFRIVSGG